MGINIRFDIGETTETEPNLSHMTGIVHAVMRSVIRNPSRTVHKIFGMRFEKCFAAKEE